MSQNALCHEAGRTGEPKASHGHGCPGHHGHGAPAKPSGDGLYYCPMCPVQEQAEPGVCGKCGMALEAPDLGLPAAKTQYSCPMHPEILQDEPGSCPKCGMALEPITVAAE